MKNKGIKIGVVFLLLFALLSVAGCQQEDVVIVGAESGQPGPTSGQLRISFSQWYLRRKINRYRT